MSRTDLEGWLRNDDPSLNTQLLRWFAKGDGDAESPDTPRLPATLKIEWRVEGASSFEQLHTITFSTLPNSTVHILSEIQERITEKLGPQPIGQIRARGWGAGSSASPGLSFTRTLAAVTMGHPDVSILRSENLWLKRQVETVQNLLVQAFQASQVTIQQLTGHVTTLSTQRAASSSVADLGSPFAALVAYVLYENRDKVMEFLREFGDKDQAKIRSEVISQAASSLKQIPTGGEIEDMTESLTRILDRARHDPVYRAQVMAKMREYPPEVVKALEAIGYGELYELEDSTKEEAPAEKVVQEEPTKVKS